MFLGKIKAAVVIIVVQIVSAIENLENHHDFITSVLFILMKSYMQHKNQYVINVYKLYTYYCRVTYI